MLDHVGFGVADFAASRVFYLAALGAIGLEVVAEGETWAMMGRSGRPEIWFGETAEAPHSGIHVAFQVGERWLVEEFHRAALDAGGRDNGAPGLRPQYSEDYYAAFAFDPDGHNIEAVCRLPP